MQSNLFRTEHGDIKLPRDFPVRLVSTDTLAYLRELDRRISDGDIKPDFEAPSFEEWRTKK